VNLVLLYLTADSFNLVWFTDADYARYLVDIKNTSGMAHFLGPCIVSWATRKQNSVALSTTEAEYITDAYSCAQHLWIKHQLKDFGIKVGCIPIKCDNKSVMNMAKNAIQHKYVKHIDVCYHFLKDNVEKGLIIMTLCCSEDHVVDIFTKRHGRRPFQWNQLA